MRALCEPSVLPLHDIAEALGKTEQEVLRQALLEDWIGRLGRFAGGLAIRIDDLPVHVLGRFLQWLSCDEEAPPRIYETDHRGEPFRYDREELWREAATLTPRQRERGRIRASAVATTESCFADSDWTFGMSARSAAKLFREASPVFRIEGITAEQIGEWSLGEEGRPGARSHHPDDWPAVLAPRRNDSDGSDPSIDEEDWVFFIALLLSPDTRFTGPEAYEAVCRRCEVFGLEEGLPPLDVFLRRARDELTCELREAAGKGVQQAISQFYERGPTVKHLPGSAVSWARDEGEERAASVRYVQDLVDDGLSVHAAAMQAAPAEFVSARTLMRWHAACKGHPRRDWAAVLTPRREWAKIHPEAWKRFKRDYLDRDRPSFALSYRRTRDAAAANGWGELPSIGTLRRRLAGELSPLAVELIRGESPA